MSASLRLGIVCYPSLGGSGIVATELGMSMARRGHEVHFISSDHPFRLATDLEGIFVHQVEVPGYPLFQEPPHMLATATKIAEVAQLHDLELIHVHYAVPHAISAYLAQQMLAPRRLPVMVTLHGTDITIVGAEPSYKPAVHFGLRAADHVTAVSRSLAQATRELFDAPCDIEVIPNFVDVHEFHPPPQPPGFEGPVVLAHASNFRPVKRPQDVLTIFEAVRLAGPARLLLAGEGPELAAIERRVQARGLVRDVAFLGAVYDLTRIFPKAHLFLLPSASESFGLAALEAMACGVPVIGANTGGLPETVTHDRSGLLFAVGDTDAMARGALELLADLPRYHAMREHARQDACQRFEREQIAGRYETRYRDLLARPTRGQ